MMRRKVRDYNMFVFQGEIEVQENNINTKQTTGGGTIYEVPIKLSAGGTNGFARIGGYSAKNRQYYSFSNKGMTSLDWVNRFSPAIISDTFTVDIDYETDQEVKDNIFEKRRKYYNIEDKNTRSLEIAKFDSQREKFEQFVDRVEAAKWVLKNKSLFEDKKVRVTGQVRFSMNTENGRKYTNYEIESISIVPDNYETYLRTNEIMYFNKDSVSTRTVDSKKEISIDGWVLDEYYNRNKQENQLRFIPREYAIQIETEGDTMTESEGQRLIAIGNLLKVEDHNYYALPVETNVVVGSQVVTAKLTDAEKQFADLGMLSSTNNMVTDYVEKNYITSFNLSAFTRNLDNEESFRKGKQQYFNATDFENNILRKEEELAPKQSFDDDIPIGNNSNNLDTPTEDKGEISKGTMEELDSIFGFNE